MKRKVKTVQIVVVPYAFHYMGLFVGGFKGTYTAPTGETKPTFTKQFWLLEGRA